MPSRPQSRSRRSGALDVTAHAVHKTRRYHYEAKVIQRNAEGTKLLLSCYFLGLGAFLDDSSCSWAVPVLAGPGALQISKHRVFIHLFAGKRNSLHFCYHIEKAVEGQ